MECVYRLGENPRSPGLHTHKIRGQPGVFGAYVDQANRVTWHWGADGQIVLRMHCNHDVLKNP